MDDSTEHVLYDKIQAVHMPGGKCQDLRITVSERGRPYKRVVLKVTDDDDPSLLYSLHVTEIDFTSLKAQQGLLVDFSHFAIHLVRLLEQCINSVKGFLVVIDESLSETCLKIVQPIDLKNLCYISLHITPGSDTEILKHMKAQIMTLKFNKETAREESSVLQQQVLQLKKELKEKDSEMQRQEHKYLEEQEAIQKKAAAEISLLRDHLLMEKKAEVDVAERKKESLAAQLQELSGELESVRKKHSKLNEKFEESQRIVRELNRCNLNMEDTHSQMRAEITDLKRQNSELEGLCRKREQELDQCRADVNMLEKQLNKLRNHFSQQEEELRKSNEEEEKLRSTVSHLQETSKERSVILRQLNSDLRKANFIIKERQKELECAHKELQLLASDIQDKDRQITKQSLEMNLLRASADKNEETIKSLTVTEEQLKKEVASLKRALTAKEEEHAKCGDVISYLHRSLKKMQIESSISPSPILYSAPALPPPTFASINPTSSSNKGPFYSTPLGTTGLLPNSERRSFPGAGKKQITEKAACSTGRKSEEAPSKETFRKNQIATTQKSQKRSPLSTDSGKLKQNTEVLSEKRSASAKSKENKEADLKDTAKKSQNKENKKAALFQPSSYFQPNRIITDF